MTQTTGLEGNIAETEAVSGEVSGTVALVQGYTLPKATKTILGGIKVGDNLSVKNGVLSADVSQEQLDSKVEKVEGKSLIADIEIERLSNVDNYDDTSINNKLNGTESMGSIVVEDVTCKNLFNAYSVNIVARSNMESCTINNANKITVTGLYSTSVWARATITINGLKPNTKYTINSDVTNSSGHRVGLLCDYDTNNINNISTDTSFNSKITVTTDSNGIVAIQFFSNHSSTAQTETVIFDNIQLEEGTSNSNYVKHKKIDIQTNIITANLKEDYTISTQSSVLTVPISETVKIGDKFTTSNNNIVIGSGISYIKVSANVRVDNTASGDILFAYITSNDSTKIYSCSISSGARTSLTISPYLLKVNEGDIINLKVQNSSSATSKLLSANRLATYVTLEAVC